MSNEKIRKTRHRKRNQKKKSKDKKAFKTKDTFKLTNCNVMPISWKNGTLRVLITGRKI